MESQLTNFIASSLLHLLFVSGRIVTRSIVVICVLFSLVTFKSTLAVSAAEQTQTSTTRQNAKELPQFANGEHALKAGETHSYHINLLAGQFLYANIVQNGIDVVITIWSPDHSTLATTDSPNERWGAEPVLVEAKISGEYRIDVRSPNVKAEGGRYVIEILAQRQSTADDALHVAGERMFEEAQRLRSQPNAASKRLSIAKYEISENAFRQVGDNYRRALTLLMHGTAFVQLNEFRSARPVLAESLELAANLSDTRLESSVETGLGFVADVLGEVRSSREHYERAVLLSQQLDNNSTQGSALNNIGKLYNDAGDFQAALEYYKKALPFMSDLRRRAITLNNLGVAYTNLAEGTIAVGYLQQSLAILHAGEDRSAESYTLSNIGSAYRVMGSFGEALSFYAQARQIQQQTGNRAQEAETLDLIGVTYSAMGQPEKALDYHQQALEIQRTTKNIRREALCLSNLGHVYSLLGQPEKAVSDFDQSLTILRQIGDLNNSAIALEGRARAEQQLKNLAEARKNIEESLILIETVRAHSGSQQLRAAYLASREKAYEFYVGLLMQLNATEPGKGHDAGALQASERARARSLMEMLNEAHVDIQEGVGAELVTRERDLRQSLNAKAQRLIQLTASKGSQQEIEALNKESSALEDEYQQVQVAIRKASPAYAALTQPQPLSLKEIQQQLDPNTVLLEYSLGDERSYLWAITQETLKTYELQRRDKIQKVAQQVYELLTARTVVKALETPAERQQRVAQADSQFPQVAAELSKMVLAPAANELGTRRLVVVADGALQYVPFASLSAVSSQPVATSYRPLILDHEVISLPSASALAVQRRTLANRKPAPRAIAVIADPVFSVTDARFKANAKTVEVKEQTPARTSGANDTRIIEHLADNVTGQLSIRRLPFTRQEAEQILAVAPSPSNLKALDFLASRSTATGGELSKYRYVHFATHGYLDSSRADSSAIVLSLFDRDGKPDDGFLHVRDVYRLNLPAEVVTLSACETGLGKDVKGEGLVGLTQGFMYAGARRVVVSLWNVNDKATADLMTKFYQKMLKQGERPAAALRTAQVAMWNQKQWQSPYYWAAFVMQGEWR